MVVGTGTLVPIPIKGSTVWMHSALLLSLKSLPICHHLITHKLSMVTMRPSECVLQITKKKRIEKKKKKEEELYNQSVS